MPELRPSFRAFTTLVEDEHWGVCKGSGHMEHAGALKAGALTSGEAVGNESVLSRASIDCSSLDCLRPGMDSTRNSRIPSGIRQRGHPLGTVGKGLWHRKGRADGTQHL